MVIYCATSNPGKLAEFQLAAPPGWQLLPAGPLDCPETGGTFAENAIQKALGYSRRVPGLVFADDSGLEVEQLGGEPGIRSARYAGPQANDAENRALLLENLRHSGRGAPPPTYPQARPNDARQTDARQPEAGQPPAVRPKARFVCAIALAHRGCLLATFQETVRGEILDHEQGAGGFGYDALFFFPPLGRTFAELSPQEKLVHSHRGKAFRAMVQWWESHRSEEWNG